MYWRPTYNRIDTEGIFELDITPDMCNYHLRCEAVQKIKATDSILFEKSEISPIKLCDKVVFTDTDKLVTINKAFNTSSDSFEVQWNIRALGNIVLTLRPNEASPDGAIFANNINSSMNEHRASLLIKNTEVVDQESLHYLNVNSGGVSKQYGFFLVKKGKLNSRVK